MALTRVRRGYRRRHPGAGALDGATLIFSLRVTPEQSVLLQDAAEADGISTSEVIRRRVFGPLPPLTPERTD